MIVEGVRALYQQKAEKESGRGNPTGSKLGACTAQLQQMMWRDHLDVPPAPWQPRSVMTVEMGRLLGEWMAGIVGQSFPGLFGLKEQPFYLPIPYPDGIKPDEVERVFGLRVGERLANNSRRLWGTLLGPKDRFTPPKVEILKGGQLKTTGISLGNPQKDWRGLVLEPRKRMLWTPVFVDGVLNHPEHGLAVVEDKTMSTPAFRRALLGRMDYGYRAQLLAAVKATGFDLAVWLCLRKETAHWAEITFLRKHAGVRVDLIRTSGVRESYIVADADKGILVPAEGEAKGRDLNLLDAIEINKRDATWDTALVWSPFEEGALLEQMYQRAWRVVLSTADRGAEGWLREYGPEFACRKCAGEGKLTCRQCHGTGVTPKLRKPCGPCGGAMTLPCEPCKGTGQLEEAELPWQCSYCSVNENCWGKAGVRLEVDSRPHYLVRRDAYLASGLGFVPPEREAALEENDEPGAA